MDQPQPGAAPGAAAGWREELDRLALPAPPPPLAAPALGPEDLRRLIATACAGARGLVVGASHDRYVEFPGGVNLLIADEQRKFNGDRAVYLHLSPVAPADGLAPDTAAPLRLNILVDGAVRGAATAGSVALALAALVAGPAAAFSRLFVVHTLHGHRPEALAAIAAALRPTHALFWLHDFAALCANPRLLRNDIAFCAAPPPKSLACRVCVHGPARPPHLARLHALFAAVRFHVIAPSPAAADLFRRATDLPIAGLHLHPHVRLEPSTALAPTADGPPRIAFVGAAAYHTGWPRFAAAVAALGPAAGIAWFHVAGERDLRPLDGVTPIAAESTAPKPYGLVRALTEHRIDLVLALAPWPEPFSLAAHAALAAGADLLATEGSGAAALAAATPGSHVVADDAALSAFLRNDAAAHVRARRAAGRPAPTLAHSGSTATLAFDATAPTTDAPDLHLLLRGARLDGSESGGHWRFLLPQADPADAKRIVRLRSRHLRGTWDRAAEGDRRRLGVAVADLTLDGIALPPADPRRVGGWHKPEPDGWQWTDGDAALLVGAARRLELRLLPLARYWRAPLLATPAP